MFCYKCGASMPDDIQFCCACGAPSANQLMQPVVAIAKPKKKRSFSAGVGFVSLIVMIVAVVAGIIWLSVEDADIVEQVMRALNADDVMVRFAWSLAPIAILAVYAGMKYYGVNVRALLTVALAALAVYFLAMAIFEIKTSLEYIEEEYARSERKYVIWQYLPSNIVFAIPSLFLPIYLAIKSIKGVENISVINTAIISCFTFELARVLGNVFGRVSIICTYSRIGMGYSWAEKEILTVGVYPLIGAIIQFVLVALLFIVLDRIVPNGIKVKNDTAEEVGEAI